jgi:hypothetical protein
LDVGELVLCGLLATPSKPILLIKFCKTLEKRFFGKGGILEKNFGVCTP